jgi:hypothetical protein
MEIRQLIQVGLWTKLLGIYYKRNSYTDEADFLGNPFLQFLQWQISETYLVKPYKVSFTGKTKKLGERIKALDEQTQRATVEHTANQTVAISKDSVVCMPKAFYGNTNTR